MRIIKNGTWYELNISFKFPKSWTASPLSVSSIWILQFYTLLNNWTVFIVCYPERNYTVNLIHQSYCDWILMLTILAHGHIYTFKVIANKRILGQNTLTLKAFKLAPQRWSWLESYWTLISFLHPSYSQLLNCVHVWKVYLAIRLEVVI